MDLVESAKASLLQVWKERDIQITVLTSLSVQLFLLFTGDLRRRRINGFLRSIIWLAYVGADAVAIFSIGLYSEEKNNLRSQDSSGDQSLLFLWAPFLLLHLGGQDTITAFSLEDNNLWLRHLLNLVVQVTLTLYVLWKSFEKLELPLLAIALPIFVAGTIKYGERTWALYSGSRDYLGSRNEREEVPLSSGNAREFTPLRDYRSSCCGDTIATYALNTVLRVRGLLVGRTLLQLGQKIMEELVIDFAEYGEIEGTYKIVMMELGMMYDLLYTKAMVLQNWTGRILRCIAEMCIVVSFVVFMANRKLHAQHNRANIAITYTLFVGALFMEASSVSMVIVSPWTRARSKKCTFLYWLSCRACSLCNVVMWRKTNQQQQLSIGQFNLTDYSISEKCTARLISKVVTALGLENKWRNFWHIRHAKVDKETSSYVVSLVTLLFSRNGLEQLNLGRRFNYVLCLPFEHALFRLHIFTDIYLNEERLSADKDMRDLAAECRKLSQYLIYLMVVYPSMLPVSNAAQDLEYYYAAWVRDEYRGSGTTQNKQQILCQYADERLYNEENSKYPFESLLPPSVESLKVLKEVWVRLLIYAAGKCPAEIHARQLGDGLELLTAVWLLMLHHGVGDVGMREINLFESHDPYVPRAGSLVPVDKSSWTELPQGPLHAFEFHHIQNAPQPPQDASTTPTDNSREYGSSSDIHEAGHVAVGIELIVVVPPEIDQSGE